MKIIGLLMCKFEIFQFCTSLYDITRQFMAFETIIKMDDPFLSTCCVCTNRRKNNNWPKVKSICTVCKKKIKRKNGIRAFHFRCEGCRLIE